MLKQCRFLTAFRQDGNPLIQLNQDNIENAMIQRIMPPTWRTEKKQQYNRKTFQTVNKRIFSFLIERTHFKLIALRNKRKRR